MAENEKTSPRIATLAAKILKMQQPLFMNAELWAEIKEVAGSALTQAPDKPKELPLMAAYKNRALLTNHPLNKFKNDDWFTRLYNDTKPKS